MAAYIGDGQYLNIDHDLIPAERTGTLLYRGQDHIYVVNMGVSSVLMSNGNTLPLPSGLLVVCTTPPTYDQDGKYVETDPRICFVEEGVVMIPSFTSDMVYIYPI